MYTLVLCLFITAWLPFLSKIAVASAMAKEGGYDNNHPREQQKKLKGYGARALAAHQNSFEALLIFAVAVLSALVTHTNSWLTNYLAITFVISRILYHAFYLMNLSTLRSLIWFVGFGSSMFILGSCLTYRI